MSFGRLSNVVIKLHNWPLVTGALEITAHSSQNLNPEIGRPISISLPLWPNGEVIYDHKFRSSKYKRVDKHVFLKLEDSGCIQAALEIDLIIF